MKTVREVAVELENKPGVLSNLTDLLGANGITILALTVRPAGTTGILSFVSTDPARVVNILESAGYKPVVNEILASQAPDHPGGLNAILKPLKRAGVNVEYLYSCIGCSGIHSIIFLGVDNLSAAHDALSREWIHLYGEELYAL